MNTVDPQELDTKPWYAQFWPWFLISLPATAVIAGFITLDLAIQSNDGLVSDDYYKEGLAVNKDLARDALTRRLGLEAYASYDPKTQEFGVTLHQRDGTPIEALTLELIHPTRAHHDLSIAMTAQGQGRFTVRLPAAMPTAYWHIRLSPPDGRWRLENRLRLPAAGAVLMK